MFNNMWSLFVGTTEVTDDEEENELNEATKMAARRELANIPPLHSTRIARPEEVVVSKVRIPSPAREQGDGMEADQEVAKASAAEEVPPVSIPKPKLITLPQVNFTFLSLYSVSLKILSVCCRICNLGYCLTESSHYLSML